MEEITMTYTEALMTLSIFLIGHLIAAVWWASHVNTVLSAMIKAIDKLTTTLTKHEEKHYSKVEAAKDLSVRDKQIEAAFKKMERLQLTVSELRAG
jgi:hypothetical protein